MPGSVFRTGAALVAFDESGAVVGLSDAVRPASGFLLRAGEPVVRHRGRAVAWGPAQVAVDVDELELALDSEVGVRAVVRHTFEPRWTVRLLLVATGTTAVRLDDVSLTWQPAPDHPAVALAAGSVAAYAVQPPTGHGPVLVGRLSSGIQAHVDGTTLGLGPVELAPGTRHVTQWRWELVRSARQATAPGQLPVTTWLEAEQTVVLAAGPDVAVVAPGLQVESGEDAVEVSAARPGSYELELRSARGTTTFALDWAPDLTELLTVAAERALTGRTTPAGTPRLPSAASGLVVQEALGRRCVDDPERAEDALELLAGALADAGDLDPLGLAFLAREADRAGDRGALDRATAGVLAAAAPTPGLGLAATRLYLARIRSGLPVAALTTHLAGLAAAGRSVGEVSGAAAVLELALLTRPRGLATGPGEQVQHLALRVGAELGAGLPGRRLEPLELDALAHLAAVLALVPEDLGHDLRAWWGISAAELTRRTAAQVRARLDKDAVRALAWLVLAAPLG